MSEMTVLGMGAMGRALATSLVAAGHSVTVWNRTPRDVPGTTVAASAAEAVAASPVVAVCVVDYAAMWSFLPDMTGHTVVNLTNGTPAQAREAATKVESYVDGGVMAVPRMIGRPGSLILYSGSAHAFEETRPLLETWGTARFLGDDPGKAALYDLALLSAMYGMFGGVYHALAMTDGEIRPLLKPWLDAMSTSLPDGANHPDSNLAMQARAYVNLLTASRDQGVRTDLVAPMGDLLTEAVATGKTLVEVLDVRQRVQ